MSPWLVLLGGNELNSGFRQIADFIGARLLVVDWNETPGFVGDEHLRLDIKDSDDVLAALQPRLQQICFAYSSVDIATETVARINQAIGLARPDAAALDRARDKFAMNQRWEAAGLLGKSYRHCRTPREIADFIAALKGDVIVKPEKASSSRGITVLSYEDSETADCSALWARAAQFDASQGVIVEEFVAGTEFTVEMLGDGHGNVEVWGVSKKYHTASTRLNRIATKLHYNPADEAVSELRRLADFGRECYQALGLSNSFGHFEVIRGKDGRLVPVELAARSSGFIASHLLDAAAGREGGFMAAYHAMLRGKRLANRMIACPNSSMYFFYDPPAGTWQADGLTLTDFLPEGIRSLGHDRGQLHTGRHFGVIDCDNERVGYEILVGPQDALTIDQVFAAERRLYNAGFAAQTRRGERS